MFDDQKNFRSQRFVKFGNFKISIRISYLFAIENIDDDFQSNNNQVSAEIFFLLNKFVPLLKHHKRTNIFSFIDIKFQMKNLFLILSTIIFVNGHLHGEWWTVGNVTDASGNGGEIFALLEDTITCKLMVSYLKIFFFSNCRFFFFFLWRHLLLKEIF